MTKEEELKNKVIQLEAKKESFRNLYSNERVLHEADKATHQECIKGLQNELHIHRNYMNILNAQALLIERI